MSQSTQVQHLLQLLTDSVCSLNEICASNDTRIPDLNEPYHPASEAFRANPDAQRAAAIISAAASQLQAIFSPPQVSLYHVAAGTFRSAALRVCIEGHVTEILREAGPEGLHVNQIAAINGLDAKKLARFLRYLASLHVYTELAPDVFANNRISSMMDTHKCPLANQKSSPERKHENTSGFPALVSSHLDEVAKAAIYSWEAMSDPEMGHSTKNNATPLNKAFGTENLTYFGFLQDPRQSARHQRFAVAMEGVTMFQPDLFAQAYDWKSLPAGSVVVDVGGGVGTVSLALAEEFPDINIVVQDLPSIVEKGHKVWSTRQPEALKSGRVVLQAHDFFTEQPQKDASVFLVKHVLHNWSDEDCQKMLSRLRDAARPDTKLLVLEIIMPYVCHQDTQGKKSVIPGATPREAPKPLLANFGSVNEFAYVLDMLVFSLCNSEERTIDQFDELFRKSGWKLTKVHRVSEDLSMWQSIEAVPA
uniref:Putative S-adenosyl-L-methionine-dependent methyltransferase n=1 Tax=Moniliophthora roreri TaxID=221103 RepID=A0A0W0F268_MONRR